MDLMNIAKIAAMVVVLILLRVGVQALMKSGPTPGRLTRALPFLLPPLITGGPMFLALPIAAAVMNDPTVPPVFVFLAFGGAVLLGFGLAGLFVLVSRQQRQIDELRTMLGPLRDQR